MINKYKKLNRNFDKWLQKKYPNWDISNALRYLPIVDDIKSSFKKGSKILDIGSGDYGINVYMGNGFNLVGTDIENGKNEKFKVIKASVVDLPFENESFDVVVSVDMVEHLLPEDRKKAISEMIRVAKDRAYITFPSGKDSEVVDRILYKYYKFTHKKELPFLNEHIEYGLPSPSEIEKYIISSGIKKGQNVSFQKKLNTNIFLWVYMLFLGFSEKKLLTNIYHKLLFFLPILRIMNFWPTYRITYIVKCKGNGK